MAAFGFFDQDKISGRSERGKMISVFISFDADDVEAENHNYVYDEEYYGKSWEREKDDFYRQKLWSVFCLS